MTARFRREPWRVEWVDDVGERMRALGAERYDRWRGRFSGAVSYAHRTLVVDAGLEGRELIGTLVHEAIHAEEPDLSEATVRRLERAVVSLVWPVVRRG